MRYFAEIAYLGTDFSGWQIQPGKPTVQGTIETTLNTLLRKPVPVVGCGRTDAGVHASQYYLHFDADRTYDTDGLQYKLNRMLPGSIAVCNIYAVAPDAHARFDAISRTYRYFVHADKNPFSAATSFHFPFWDNLDIAALNASVALLKNYKAFFPFCKTRSDTTHYLVDLQHIHWEISERKAVFEVRANRFLRGMVRLIVGMCLEVARGKIRPEEVKEAMDDQTHLRKGFSAPPHGLFLHSVRYPEDLFH